MFEIICYILFLVATAALLISLGRISSELKKVREERRFLEERIRENEEKLSDSFSEIDGMKAKLTLSQINPHFIFNTLNTIYYLCEKDSGEAQSAIEDFSAYLRENMDSIKNMEPIPFKKELVHVKRYLERNFTHLQICFGCTGGRHRSVYCAEQLAAHLAKNFNVKVLLTHREMKVEKTLR